MEKISNNFNSLKIFLGTYEGKIISLNLDLKTKEINVLQFKVSENSLKTIYHNNQEKNKSQNYIFASGLDEIIHIYDMEKKQDKGSVFTYSGSVTTLQIMKNYLFAGGDDPNIFIWRMADFNLIHSLKGHKAAISHFIVHKSGKFCLSASRDNTFIIWNLVQGRKIIKYQFKNNLICNKILLVKKESLAILIFDFEVWLFDFFKNSENYDDWVLKKIKIPQIAGQVLNIINDAFAIKNNLFVVHSNGVIKVYNDITNSESEAEPIELIIEKPDKLNENDLDIKVKTITISKNKKLKLLNVIFSNNEIYIYDLNKVLKNLPSSLDSQITVVKKFYSTILKTSDRITCIDSQI